MLEVLTTLEGPISILKCLTHEDACDRIRPCVARTVWMDVNQATEKALSCITLGQNVARAREFSRSAQLRDLTGERAAPLTQLDAPAALQTPHRPGPDLQSLARKRGLHQLSVYCNIPISKPLRLKEERQWIRKNCDRWRRRRRQCGGARGAWRRGGNRSARGPYVSFANCGLPYHVGGEIADRARPLVTTPENLRTRFRIAVRTRNEVTAIDPMKKEVEIKNPRAAKSTAKATTCSS